MTSDEIVGPARAVGRPALHGTLVVALAVVAVLALAGIGLAIAVVAGSAPSAEDRALKGPYGVQQDVPTSFGAIAVDGLAHIAPTSHVGRKMKAFVTLTNLLDRPVRYAPSQFRLVGREDESPVARVKTTLHAGTILPDASVSGQLTFAAPAKGAKLWLRYADPNRDEPILIDLTRQGAVTPGSVFKRFIEHDQS